MLSPGSIFSSLIGTLTQKIGKNCKYKKTPSGLGSIIEDNTVTQLALRDRKSSNQTKCRIINILKTSEASTRSTGQRTRGGGEGHSRQGLISFLYKKEEQQKDERIRKFEAWFGTITYPNWGPYPKHGISSRRKYVNISKNQIHMKGTGIVRKAAYNRRCFVVRVLAL